ncbi:MAG: 4'-phosphopantetheinyl transferase superfamily protein [Acidobacteriota bacterium]
MMKADQIWQPPPAKLVLGNREVHVWRAWLTELAACKEQLSLILSEDERDRAGRFHFVRDQTNFVVGRGLLRVLLSRYTGLEPERLVFSYGSRGKPALSLADAETTLRFNLSHSHEMALFAFTKEREIGVDVEWTERDIEIEQIAERFFSPTEASAIQLLSGVSQRQAFYNCWTRKEAFIKARGDGLSLDLAAFDVSLIPGETAALLKTRWEPGEAARWSLRDIKVGDGYAGALAVEGDIGELNCWQWLGSQEGSSKGV